MTEASITRDQEDPPMDHREIELADGRYLIFYTFGRDAVPDGDDPREDV